MLITNAHGRGGSGFLIAAVRPVVADRWKTYQIKWTQTSLMKAHTVSP